MTPGSGDSEPFTHSSSREPDCSEKPGVRTSAQVPSAPDSVVPHEPAASPAASDDGSAQSCTQTGWLPFSAP